jgi:microcystin degradation protein MlrC
MKRRSFLKSVPLAAAYSFASAHMLAAQAKQPRIAFGGISIECSTYSELRTTVEDFTILRGAELRSSPIFAFLNRYPMPFMPTLTAVATPGGALNRATYDTIKTDFLQRLTALLPLDGLYLSMHGAMSVEGMFDAEGDWMEAARKVVGPTCLISASYDLHGSVSQRVIDNIDLFSAFRTAPHIDVEATKVRATDMLVHCLQAHIRPTLMWAPIPDLVSGEISSTLWEPGKHLWAQLPQMNRTPGVLDVSMLVGYMWADEPRSTACVVVTGTAPAAQKTIALKLAQQYWDARKDFKWGTTICSLEECVQKAVSAKTQPAIVADSGDNDTAGGVGDRADALRELLRVKANGVVLAGIADRPATDACYKAGVGATIPLSIGATLDSKASKPVKVQATVKFLLKTDTPRLREAVVQVEGITVVLGAYRRPYHDIIDFTRLGLQPKSFKIIVVKSGYLSPELDPIANPSLLALSDGSVNQDELHLPNHNRKPLYPFVPNLTFKPQVYLSARSRA